MWTTVSWSQRPSSAGRSHQHLYTETSGTRMSAQIVQDITFKKKKNFNEKRQMNMLVFHRYNTLVILPFLHSAILYLNDNFSGGELFFTNRDAKTVTVSHFFQPEVTLISWSFHNKFNHCSLLHRVFRLKLSPAAAAWWASPRVLSIHTVLRRWPVVGGVRWPCGSRRRSSTGTWWEPWHRHTALTSVLQPCGGSCCGTRVR